MMKTARFKTIVEKAGKPRIYFQFLPADKDPQLQSALKKNRVMSVNQTAVGQRKDIGTVGYTGSDASQILIFPANLTLFKDRKIVGLDYSLLEEPVDVTPEKSGPKTKPPTALAKNKAPAVAPLPPRVSAKAMGDPPQAKPQTSKPQKKIFKAPVPKTSKPNSSGPPSKLKRQLEEVLSEWEAGHDVKASKLLTSIVAAL